MGYFLAFFPKKEFQFICGEFYYSSNKLFVIKVLRNCAIKGVFLKKTRAGGR